jgi:hypothetical protein
MIGPVKLLRPAQQLRQLGDIRRDPAMMLFAHCGCIEAAGALAPGPIAMMLELNAHVR